MTETEARASACARCGGPLAQYDIFEDPSGRWKHRYQMDCINCLRSENERLKAVKSATSQTGKKKGA